MKIRTMVWTLATAFCVASYPLTTVARSIFYKPLFSWLVRFKSNASRPVKANPVKDVLRSSVESTSNNGTVNSHKSEICLARNRLKPVSQSEQNIFAKALASRRDSYDARADMDSFIRKLRVSDGVVIKNETPVEAIVAIVLELNKSSARQEITIKPGEYHVLDKHDAMRVNSIALIGSNYYMNPKWTIDSHLQITIEAEQDKHFLHQYHGFGFASLPFTNEELADLNQSEQERLFKKGFNNHLSYVDMVFARSEGLTLQGIDEHRRALFAKNNIATILERNPHAIDTYENKIPLITHKIWVTSDDKPVSLPNYYLEWFENSIKHNPVSAGWKHILWIESKEKLPELAKKLKNHPHITLMELKDLPEALVTGDMYKNAIKAKQFGKASDILRLEILRQFGGFYLDTDYELFQSLKPYSKVYDMVVAVEPMSAFICNAFIAACPNHPVVNKGLSLIVRNLNPETVPAYIKNNHDVGFKTIIETGPALLTAAFALAGGQHGKVDIAMPPMLIYPTSVDAYPCNQVVKPNEAIPSQAIGAHYWETAWMKAEFGSKG